MCYQEPYKKYFNSINYDVHDVWETGLGNTRSKAQILFHATDLYVILDGRFMEVGCTYTVY